MTAFPSPVASSCRTYYGVQVVDVGEEGDMLVLGHDHLPRRVIAAINAHARYLGAQGGIELADTYVETLANLRESWAQLHTECCGAPLPDPEHPEAPCPVGCDRDRPAGQREYAWCADWWATADTAGAFAVTVWSA